MNGKIRKMIIHVAEEDMDANGDTTVDIGAAYNATYVVLTAVHFVPGVIKHNFGGAGGTPSEVVEFPFLPDLTQETDVMLISLSCLESPIGNTDQLHPTFNSFLMPLGHYHRDRVEPWLTNRVQGGGASDPPVEPIDFQEWHQQNIKMGVNSGLIPQTFTLSVLKYKYTNPTMGTEKFELQYSLGNKRTATGYPAASPNSYSDIAYPDSHGWSLKLEFDVILS